MINCVVFTAVFGRDVDRLRPPKIIAPEVEYRCYTDSPFFEVEGWHMIRTPFAKDPVMAARGVKILSHKTEPDADVTIWQDSAYCLQVHPWALLHGEFSVRALRHPWRDTVRTEGAEIVRKHLACSDRIDAQVKEYESMWWHQAHLTSTGLLVRVNTPAVSHFNEYWWEELERWGHSRDQMSVDYSAFATKVPIEYLPGNYRDNVFAHWKAGRR